MSKEEKDTRERVDVLEAKQYALDARVTDFAQWKAHQQVAQNTFWGRLRWIFTGKTWALAFLAVPLVVGCGVRRDETQRLAAATAARVVALETKVNAMAIEAAQDREELLSLRVSHTKVLDSHGRRIRAFEREYPLGTGYVRK